MADTTPVSRRSASNAVTASQMKAVLRGASLHPPPPNALDSTSGVASELMAVSHKLDLAILCADNKICAANLLDFPNDDGEDGLEKDSVGRFRTTEDPLKEVSFAFDHAPRPDDDESIPSKAIPAKTRIRGLEFSPPGHSLLIWGESYVAVARLPNSANFRGGAGRSTPSRTAATPPSATSTRGALTRYDREGDSGGDDSTTKWRWTLLDMSGHVVDTMRHRVVHATWHPASDGCVTLLTVAREEGPMAAAALEETTARSFVMLHVPGRAKPEKVLPIPDGVSKSQAVAIAHGRGAGWSRFAVWIARRDGSVAALSPVVPKNAKVDIEELTELWSMTCDKLVAARYEESSGSGQNQADLEEEIAHLEQQQAWLRETFRNVLDEEILHHDSAMLSTTATSAVEVRGPHNSGGATPMPLRYPILQDDVVVRRGVTTTADAQGAAGDVRGEEAGAACALVMLKGHEKGGDFRGMVCAPLPTVLAVGYRSGLVDVAVLPGGIAPRWSQRFGARASCPPEERASVFETLDLGEWSTDKAARRRQGLALSVGLSAWTLLTATPCRLTRITVEWASSIEKAVAHARRRAVSARTGSNSGRLDGDLKAVLTERPESSVAELLYVPSSAQATICALTPVARVQVGHLVLARLTSGLVELVNLSVVTAQATEVASAAKRALTQGTPGRGDMLPPFEASLQKAEAALEERRLNKLLGPNVGRLRVPELDSKGLQFVEAQAERLMDGGIAVLEKLHNKTTIRLETLREVYEHQGGLVADVSKDVARLRTEQEVVMEALEENNRLADTYRERAAMILNVMQHTRSSVSAAERAFMAEIKDMENYADRVQVKIEPATKQIQELMLAEREAEDFLVREAEGASGGGGSGRPAGPGLSEAEMRDIWNMLQADRKRILDMNSRLEAARKRLAELDVGQEE